MRIINTTGRKIFNDAIDLPAGPYRIRLAEDGVKVVFREQNESDLAAWLDESHVAVVTKETALALPRDKRRFVLIPVHALTDEHGDYRELVRGGDIGE